MSKRFEPVSAVRSLFAARRSLRYLVPTSALVVLLAGGGFAALETDTVESYWEGVWWALSLMTTVGFANGAPHSLPGKMLAGAVMVFGFVLLALTTAAIASLFVREDEESDKARLQVFERNVMAELSKLDGRLERIEAHLQSQESESERPKRATDTSTR
ncbi:MAG: potassium channel family protein [Solirubrobacterales bacterium]